MNIVLFDDPSIRIQLLPFTFTRPVAKMRVGILTIDEKWQKLIGTKPSSLTEEYLSAKFPVNQTDDNLLINGALCPDENLVHALKGLSKGSGLIKNGIRLALRAEKASLDHFEKANLIEYEGNVTLIDQVWKIFQQNAAQLRADFKLITAGRKSQGVQDKHTIRYHEENIFVEEGVTIRAAVLNAEDGPIYLGKNSVIQEGALIKGPFALCEGSHVNMGGKMRGDSTIGPYSKVGGEITNSVIFGYSNKAHDGFLGNSVLGEWCNLGADTNTSNLKNNYENVKIWSYAKGGFADTGLQFCGLMMGDHSKAGINTMFNTGTVVGVSANIFGDGFPRTFIPSFAWGGASGFSTFQLAKAFDTAQKVMARRNLSLDEVEKKILKHIFESTAGNRIWEKK
ncbi:MAG: GlmU family protein [Cyclobacteriaceae bacterium]|nr:GlmU family protein [Cyclobacteriaceae bacterium]UYN86024.1 MAG: GlmU family protein [Cyclobacteriaceae bacterium]